MPLPPDRNGPVLCVCTPPSAMTTYPRYHTASGGSVWFRPDHYSDYCPARAFALDLFAGAGPCTARDIPGFLTQWDPSWVELTDEDDVWQYNEDFANRVTIVESSDGLIAE
ncbi:hypothetical protein AURDEDRAFT_162818 [Auricularia subglabra TFB-10046 SS5]|nr:hypothetical protein AURDEDRAFT_162818 [Auricularia subglabra TFB-10046 SS5]